MGVGDLILIKPGERVPLDGKILTGNSQLDSSVLTGEFMPVTAKPGDTVLAGQINKSGALTVQVSRPFSESSISKVMDLVKNATARKAKTEKFITTFARYYTPAVVFDKTGTLTRGVFKVKKVVNLNGFSKDQLLEFAAAAELQSNHPIAISINKAFNKNGRELNSSMVADHTEIPGQGVRARYGDHLVMVGNDSLLHSESIDHSICKFDGTVTHIVVDGNYAG